MGSLSNEESVFLFEKSAAKQNGHACSLSQRLGSVVYEVPKAKEVFFEDGASASFVPKTADEPLDLPLGIPAQPSFGRRSLPFRRWRISTFLTFRDRLPARVAGMMNRVLRRI
jgi:hypothetical protein